MDDSTSGFVAALLDALPGPAALAGPDRTLRAANAAWQAAAEAGAVLPSSGAQLVEVESPAGLARAAAEVTSGRMERVSVPSPASLGSAEGPGVLVLTRFQVAGQPWLLLRREAAADVADELDQRFRSLVGAVDAGVLLIDSSGQITACNPTAARLLGRLAEEMVGRDIQQVIKELLDEQGQPIPAPERPATATLRSGQPQSNVVVGVRRGDDGSLVWLRMNTRPLREQDAPGGVVLSFVDITSERWIAQERRAAQQALAEAHAAAVRSSRLKSEFLATMSHEIRTPMSSIVAMIELMLDEGSMLSPELRDLVVGVQRSASGLLDLVEDFLDLAKIEAGRFELTDADVDLSELVHAVAEILGSRARSKQLSLAAYVDPAIGVVRADGPRLRQVLLNLVGNAVKFTRAGEVVLRVDVLADLRDAVRLRFAVSDTGIGIVAIDAEHLFEPFVRGSLDSQAEGTGLGLSICQRLVTAMGGRLTFDSVVGVGSTFTFDLTLPRATQAEPAAVLEHAGRVLVVDRHPATARALADTLRGWGCTVRVVAEPSQIDPVLTEGGWEVVVGEPQAPAALLARVQAAPPEALPRVVLLIPADPPPGPAEPGITWLAKPVAPARLWRAVTQQDTFVERRQVSRDLPELRGRVLLAEDNDVNRNLITRMLERLGLDVDSVARGDSAVDAVVAGSFDLVLMDVHMPGLNGFEATGRIRAVENGGPHLPILALTASATAGDRAACLAAGMDGHVGKPVTLRSLAQALQPWLDSGRAAAPGSAHRLSPDEPVGSVVDGPAWVALRADLRDDDLFTEMVQLYLQELPQRRYAILQAASGEELETLASAAHTLKSSSAMFGLRELAGQCAQVEALARAGDTEGVRAQVVELDTACTAVAEQLPKLVPGG